MFATAKIASQKEIKIADLSLFDKMTLSVECDEKLYLRNLTSHPSIGFKVSVYEPKRKQWGEFGTVVFKKLTQQSKVNSKDYKNALKEIIQEVALCGLSRGNFFKEAAFYGGMALRIFYGLDRFSEDMDFSLCAPNQNFSLSDSSDTLTLPILKEMLSERFKEIDFAEAKKDVRPFIQDERKLDLWSAEFLTAIAGGM